MSDDSIRERILAETDGRGAEVVLDFVGAQGTVDLATQIVAAEGAIRFVGLAVAASSTAPPRTTRRSRGESTCNGPTAAPDAIWSTSSRWHSVDAISIHTVHYALGRLPAGLRRPRGRPRRWTGRLAADGPLTADDTATQEIPCTFPSQLPTSSNGAPVYQAPTSTEFRDEQSPHRDRQAPEVQAARTVLTGPRDRRIN